MSVVDLLHRTRYAYASPVQLYPHRMMLRPREGRELKLLSYELRIAPAATVTWAHDVAGNAVATARFEGATQKLEIVSRARIDLTATRWPVFDIAASATHYPFEYSDDETVDLGGLIAPQYADPEGELAAWARGFVKAPGTDTLSLLKDISLGVAARIRYQSREVEGTQTPLETLHRGWGSCRDFAVLFAEAVRSLGFGARIVSGYLYDPARALTGSEGAGSTHAWTEVYLPGAGWITFDPTNRSITGGNRERDKRSGFGIPFRPTPRALLQFALRPGWVLNYLSHDRIGLPQLEDHIDLGGAVFTISRYFTEMLDPSMDWNDVAELVRDWDGIFCLKGVMAPDDARRAAQIGCRGVVVSNHSGRQLDGQRSPFDQLAEIVDAAGDRLDVLMDGGVTRGTHVLKALAVGAKAVGLGSYYLFPLAAAGQSGVERALTLMREELVRDMKLMGCRAVSELDRTMLRFR